MGSVSRSSSHWLDSLLVSAQKADPAGGESDTFFDSQGRIISTEAWSADSGGKIVEYDPDNVGQFSQRQTTVDGDGNIIEVDLRRPDGSGGKITYNADG